MVPVATIMMWGLKADLHIGRHKEKLMKYNFDCGIDLFPVSGPYDIVDLASTMIRINVGTGVHMVFPPGCVGMICDRSSTPLKLYGATTFGGIIDSLYTGEIKIHFHADRAIGDFVIKALNQFAKDQVAVAQIVPVPFYMPIFNLLSVKPIVAGRGDQGYGSTDTQIN